MEAHSSVSGEGHRPPLAWPNPTRTLCVSNRGGNGTPPVLSFVRFRGLHQHGPVLTHRFNSVRTLHSKIDRDRENINVLNAPETSTVKSSPPRPNPERQAAARERRARPGRHRRLAPSHQHSERRADDRAADHRPRVARIRGTRPYSDSSTTSASGPPCRDPGTEDLPALRAAGVDTT